jgi:hypothetical protein
LQRASTEGHNVAEPELEAARLLETLSTPSKEAKDAPQWMKGAEGMLEAAGGAWAEAGRRVREAAAAAPA